MRDVLIVAGETSGDLHGASLTAALRARVPGVRVVGLGGERMQAAGVELLEDAARMSVMGVVEVLRSVPHHWALLRRLDRRMADGGIGLVILLDYPGFNMKVAAAARRHGVPVLYYITPQVWAWGAGRLPTLAKLITRAAVILPFEEALLRQHGIDASFVGHPLLDRAQSLPTRDEAREALGLSATGKVLALFPGSRRQEIDRHLATFSDTARRLQATWPGLQVIVSVAPGIRIDPMICPYPLVHDASWRVLRAADAALCKSGTTTLEAAVAGCPHIVAYKTSGWTFAIARRLVTIPRIGLVNVVAESEVAPEFVQDAAEPPAMARALAPLLDATTLERQRMVASLDAVRDRLGTPGAAARTAAIAATMLA